MKAIKYLLLALASTLSPYSTAIAQDAAGFSGIPLPPAQGTAWTAPATALPAEVVRAANALFDQGMADPRGCEYREVEIAFDYPLKTHAWVIPTNEGVARYAVGWNGLVYPVKSVGAPADLAKDLADSTAKWRFRSTVEPLGERYALSTESVARLKLAMLLRLGETALAEKFWREGNADNETGSRVDPHADMTAVWLGSWYNTAVRAYLRDDYSAVLAICHELSPVLAKARETARSNGLVDPWPERHDGLPFWQMPRLVTEAQRRVDEKFGSSAPAADQKAGEAERIAALIRELDQVRVQQMMTPGQTDVLEDPVVQKLVAEGGTAVPALLRCLVEDQRLTRSRFTGGGWTMESGPIIPVYEAAYMALFRLLNVKFSVFAHDGDKGDWQDHREPRDLSPEDRRALADKLDAVWQKRHGVDPVEQAYATLRDDDAGEKAWLQAVDTIVQPTNGQFTDYLLVRPAVGSYSVYTSAKPFTPRGEPLRSRTDPSVAELMVRRFGQLSASEKTPWGTRETDRPGKFLLALAAWDGKAHLDDLRRLQGELLTRFQHLAATPPETEGKGQDLIEQAQVLVRLHEMRAELGDATALDDYTNFLGPLTPQMLGKTWGDVTELFRPMWRHPDAPAVARTAEKIFGAGSPWVPFGRKATHDLTSLIHSHLVAVPAFQREIVRGLGDTSDAGQVVVNEGGYSDGNGAYSTTPDPLAPPAGTKSVYRLCDQYAHALSKIGGFPRCELYWPLAECDRAVEASRAFLLRYAGNLRYRESEDKNNDRYSYGSPTIRFPLLDHPATEEDVREGRAIFSLPPPARVCRLSRAPLVAERHGPKTDPGAGIASVAASGTSGPTTAYDDRGMVWQAEETLVDGRWQRYVGFVGRYQVAKVAAEKMDFPIGRGASNVTPQISGSLEVVAPLLASEGFRFGYSRRAAFSPDQRIPVQLKVANHSGFDQIVPGTLILMPKAEPGTLPVGVRFALSYSEKRPELAQRYNDPPFDYGVWQDVPPRERVKTVFNDDAGPVLLPGEYDHVVMEADLRDYFDLSRPGSYRLETVFQVAGQPESRADGGIFIVE